MLSFYLALIFFYSDEKTGSSMKKRGQITINSRISTWGTHFKFETKQGALTQGGEGGFN